MVDAVTQTERSDYYTLKMRALKRQLKQQKAESPTKPRGEHLVKLRIANIQLHDAGASAGPQSGAYQPHPSLVQHGPTVADFAAVFSPQVLVPKGQPQADWKRKQQLSSTGYAGLGFSAAAQAAPVLSSTHAETALARQRQAAGVAAGLA